MPSGAKERATTGKREGERSRDAEREGQGLDSRKLCEQGARVKGWEEDRHAVQAGAFARQ
jgi:hypothetical protein